MEMKIHRVLRNTWTKLSAKRIFQVYASSAVSLQPNRAAGAVWLNTAEKTTSVCTGLLTGKLVKTKEFVTCAIIRHGITTSLDIALIVLRGHRLGFAMFVNTHLFAVFARAIIVFVVFAVDK